MPVLSAASKAASIGKIAAPAAVKPAAPVKPAAAVQRAVLPAATAPADVLIPKYTPFAVPKWRSPLPIPALKAPVATTDTPPADWGQLNIAPEFNSPDPRWQHAGPTQWYQLEAKPGIQQIVDGVNTPIWGYDGQYPGQLFRTKVGQPAVVRATNSLPEEISIHLHGGHQPSHSDGHPTFVVEPNHYWDYYYPFTVPVNADGSLDKEDAPSTLFYHDHTMDLTSKHVLFGLSGFWEAFDDNQLDLIRDGVLPGWDSSWGRFDPAKFLQGQKEDGSPVATPYDIPLAIQDRRFNADGSIYFDPKDHDGYLGDVTVVNGKAYPSLTVEPRKYRFRILNGANARFYNLRLSDGQPFIGIGKDSWLYPTAIPRSQLYLGNAERADVVVDFSKYKDGDVVYLENNLIQGSGRGPGGTPENPQLASSGEQILRFQVKGAPPAKDATVAVGETLGTFTPLQASDAKVSRTFEVMRRNGHWQIDQKDYNPNRVDANPKLGDVEKWTLVNKSGGWYHAMHVHQSGHQLLSYNGKAPALPSSFREDMVNLGPNGVAEMLVEFRDYDGPFVFHCHNVEHEDLMMMGTLDISKGQPVPLGGAISRNFTPPTSSHFHWFGASAAAANRALRSDNCSVGTPADDVMVGDSQDNCLNGAAGDDRVIGRAGRDELYGADGDDALEGGANNDLLCGGVGRDVMTGGGGADVFWINALESSRDVADRITDFNGGEGDRIRLDAALLRGDAGGAYRVLDSAVFSGHAGDLLFTAGLLQADLDGDRKADLAVRLPGVDHFQQDWLMP